MPGASKVGLTAVPISNGRPIAVIRDIGREYSAYTSYYQYYCDMLSRKFFVQKKYLQIVTNVCRN